MFWCVGYLMLLWDIASGHRGIELFNKT